MKGFCSAGRVHMSVLIVMTFFLTLVPSLDILRISSPAATGEVQAAPANISAGFADLAEKLSPTVVYISTTKTIKAAGRSAAATAALLPLPRLWAPLSCGRDQSLRAGAHS